MEFFIAGKRIETGPCYFYFDAAKKGRKDVECFEFMQLKMEEDIYVFFYFGHIKRFLRLLKFYLNAASITTRSV